KDLGSTFADLRLEVKHEESVKDIESQEGDQQKALDGVGVMLVDVIGVPAVDQFVEPVIFNIPALVAQADGPFGGDQVDRKRGYPHPVTGFEIVFAVQLPAHRIRFQGTDNSHRRI